MFNKFKTYNPITFTKNQFKGVTNELAAAIGIYLICPDANTKRKNTASPEDQCIDQIYSICNKYRNRFDLTQTTLFSVIWEYLLNMDYNKIERRILFKIRLRNKNYTRNQIKLHMPLVFMVTSAYESWLANQFSNPSRYKNSSCCKISRAEVANQLIKLKDEEFDLMLHD